MIRLIASDIDGTLVPDSAHQIDPAYYDMIRALKEKRIIFCACSGRQFHSMHQLFAPVADDIYFITENGTLIRSREKIIHKWTVAPEYYIPLLEDICRIDGASAVVSYPEVSYMDSGEDSAPLRLLRDNYRYQIENVPDLRNLPREDVLKITVHCENCEEKCKDLIESDWSGKVRMAVSGWQWIDICPLDGGKGEAFAVLQDYLGVRREETIYFGDNMNDLPAFEKAGIAGTVENARAEVREKADLVAGSFNDLGVLHEMNRILEQA